MTLHVITCQNKPGYYHAQFKASAERFGVRPQILAPVGEWGGLTTKLVTVYRWLGAKRLPDRDLVLFCDAWDTFFTKSLDTFESAWQSFACPLVFSAETNCAPNGDLADAYPPAPTRYVYLNSGLYAGRPSALLDMLEDMRVYRLPPAMNDQAACVDWFLSNPGQIALDYHCRLFQSLYKAEGDLDYSGPVVRNKLTGQAAFVLHANGNASPQGVLEWLGLS